MDSVGARCGFFRFPRFFCQIVRVKNKVNCQTCSCGWSSDSRGRFYNDELMMAAWNSVYLVIGRFWNTVDTLLQGNQIILILIMRVRSRHNTPNLSFIFWEIYRVIIYETEKNELNLRPIIFLSSYDDRIMLIRSQLNTPLGTKQPVRRPK